MELEEQHLRAEKELLSKSSRKLVLEWSSDRDWGLRTKDKMLDTVRLQYMLLAVKLDCKIFKYAVAEWSDLRNDCKSTLLQWSRQWKRACDLFAVKYGDVGIVRLPPSFVVNSVRHFLSCFSSELEPMEVQRKLELRKNLRKGCSQPRIVDQK